MDSTNLFFWNVRGINSKARRDVIAELVAQERISCCVYRRPSSMYLMNISLVICTVRALSMPLSPPMEPGGLLVA
jgi:hypothetical protein